MACFKIELVNENVSEVSEDTSYLLKLTRTDIVEDSNELVTIDYSSTTLVNGVDYIGETEVTILKKQDSTYFNFIVKNTANTLGGSVVLYPSSANYSYCYARVLAIENSNAFPTSDNCCSVFADTYSQWKVENIESGEDNLGTCNSFFGVYVEPVS